MDDKVKVQSGWETGSGSYNRDVLRSGFEPALIPPHRAAPEVQNSRDTLSVADDRSPPVSVAGPHGQILSTGLSGRCWLESPGAAPLPQKLATVDIRTPELRRPDSWTAGRQPARPL